MEVKSKEPVGSAPKKSQSGKSRVKSGCRTCKARRVKCDEGKPVCQRCLKAGRVCDGYGVWGGGGNAYGSDLRKFMGRITDHYACLDQRHHFPAIKVADSEEGMCFDFFRHKTSTKLPGVFNSDFWETVVFQVSSTEPAVLHAATALASIQRAHVLEEALNGERPNGTLSAATRDGVTKWTRFALQQYNKAIVGLQSHFTAQNHRSVQIALVTCMIFICIELLRGEHETAHKHVEGGLGLLCNMRGINANHCAIPTTANARTVVRFPSSSSLDESLTEAFARMNLQSVLFGFPTRYLHVVTEAGYKNRLDMPNSFDNLQDARQFLDNLLISTIRLTETTAVPHTGVDTPPEVTNLSVDPVKEAEQLQLALSAWLRTYEASITILESSANPRTSLGLPLLRIYHTMTSILLSTCIDQLEVSDEMVYDKYTSEFDDIITRSLDLCTIFNAYSSDCTRLPVCHGGSGNFTADLGIITPLFYTALKCRVPWIRRRAISCLLIAPHREGMWDGDLAAAIARRVVGLEEQGFYAANMADVNLTWPEFTAGQSMRIPTVALPKTHRFQEIQVFLRHELKSKGKLVCGRKRSDFEIATGVGLGGDWDAIEDIFEIPSSGHSSDTMGKKDRGVQGFSHGQWMRELSRDYSS